MPSKYPHIYHAFDALRGFRELLEQEERVVILKPEFSEDYLEILDYRLRQVKIGDVISLIVLDKSDYILVEGVLVEVCYLNKYIKIVKKKYYFSDIVDLRI